jgi:hypothetical protein
LDTQSLELIVSVTTLAFVALLELTIVTISYRGMKAAMDLQRKLQPVISVVERLTPAQVEAGAIKLQRWFEKDAETERRLKEAGL